MSDSRVLDSESRRIAREELESNLLVEAGAGSGKTRTLTYRVAYLLEQGIPPDRILLLTFTNKAAREMMRRVADLLGRDLPELWGGTFHSIGVRVLRRHAELLGYRNDFTILDREDSSEPSQPDLYSQNLQPLSASACVKPPSRTTWRRSASTVAVAAIVGDGMRTVSPRPRWLEK